MIIRNLFHFSNFTANLLHPSFTRLLRSSTTPPGNSNNCYVASSIISFRPALTRSRDSLRAFLILELQNANQMSILSDSAESVLIKYASMSISTSFVLIHLVIIQPDLNFSAFLQVKFISFDMSEYLSPSRTALVALRTSFSLASVN